MEHLPGLAPAAGPSTSAPSPYRPLPRRYLSRHGSPWLAGWRRGHYGALQQDRHAGHTPPHRARSALATAPSVAGGSGAPMPGDQPQDSTAPPLEALAALSRAPGRQPAALAAPTAPGAPGGPRQQQQQQQQQLGTHGVVALAAAWDQLAPRLPLQLGLGQGSELILNALKLALAAGGGGGGRGLGQHTQQEQQQQYVQQPYQESVPPASRALATALRLADLASGGLPLDAETIAAGILAEALCRGGASDGGGQQAALQLIEQRVGPGVAHLVHDVLRVRALPSRVDLYDDEAASALRELCLTFYDPRATAVEVAARLEGLGALAGAGAPRYARQVAALEALQIYAPMGHALGMGRLTAELEDACFQLLFPESYARTAAWLRQESAAGQDTLERCQQAIRTAVLGDPRFHLLACGLSVQGRTKSLFSTLKKLLRLGETARGGRSRAEIYDLMGIRLVVQPRKDLPPAEAEEAAAQACYLVREAVHALWETLPGRCKDYIAAPKLNGYQSLHTTVLVRDATVTVSLDSEDEEGGAEAGAEGSSSTLELQIRTQAMHERAEVGQAAHAAYKGGLAASQARQLRAWTEARRVLAAAGAEEAAAAQVAQAAAVEAEAGAGVAVAAGQGTSSSSSSAGEVLFRHLDRNGDGRLSLAELGEAMAELGVAEAGGQAAELMALVDTDSDGTIDLGEFLEFHQKVGLMRAISDVDHETAEQLEHQVHPESGASSSGSGPSSSACAAAAGAGAGPSGAGSAQRGPPFMVGLRLRPASPWAAARRGLLQWAAHNASSHAAMHVNGSSAGSGGSAAGGSGGAGGGSSSSRVVSTAASTEVLSSASSSLDVELEEEQPGIIAIRPRRRGASQGRAEAEQPATTNGQAAQLPNGVAQHGGGSSSSNGSSAQAGIAAAAAAAEPSSSSSVVEALLSETEADASPEGPTSSSSSSSSPGGGDPGRPKLSARGPRMALALSAAVRPLVRVWQQNRPLPASADWRLVPAPGSSYPLQGSVAQPLAEVQLPQYGPRTVGAVRDRDCDVVLDIPTVSGRHARLWVHRNTATNTSQLFVTDVGSTNGTWVNRYKIRPFREVPLYPGDLVHFAQLDVGFIVRLGSNDAPALFAQPSTAAGTAGSDGAASSGAAAATDGAVPAELAGSLSDAQLPPTVRVAVQAALDTASALEAAAAAGGVFPPPADGALAGQQSSAEGVAQRARDLMTAGDFVAARMLLLSAVMRHPLAAGLWAQLANLERKMATHSGKASGSAPGQPAGPPNCGTARAFFGAAVACYDAAPADEAATVEGRVRVLSTWAQMEYSVGNERAGRSLFYLAIKHTETAPPAAAAVINLPQLLFTFANREWKRGDPGKASALAKRALELDPTNHFLLAMLGNIKAQAGQIKKARKLFQRALEAAPGYVVALQSWARMEADVGDLRAARKLFEQALEVEPGNTFVLQAWAVAEGRKGHAAAARALFERCLAQDPGCRSAWHAWAKLEEQQGAVETARSLYGRVLQLQPNSVETLSALGRLERLNGREEVAERLLQAALRRNPRAVSALAELAKLREAQGAEAEAARLQHSVERLNAVRQEQMQVVKRRDWKAGKAKAALNNSAAQRQPAQ